MRMIDYSKLVKEYRECKFLTQKELATKLSVGVASIIRWEKGEFEPTMKMKKKLYELFKEEELV